MILPFKIKDKNFYKTLITLAIPIMLQNLFVSSLNLTDTLMVGALGEKEIAAVGIANQFFFFYNLIIVGISTGCGMFVAQYNGTKNNSGIKKVIGSCLYCVILTGMLFTMAALFIPHTILGFFSSDPLVINLGTNYLMIVSLSYIITGLTLVFSSSLKSCKIAKAPMLVSASAFILNAVLDYIFIFGKLGFKSMGVEGSGIATLSSRILETILILIISFRKNSPLCGKLKDYFNISLSFIKNVYVSITPVILNDTFYALGIILYAVAYGKIGTHAVASIQIYNTIQNFLLIICFSISGSALVMVGNKIGAGKKKDASSYANKFVILSFTIGIILGIVVVCLSHQILSLFNVSLSVRNSTIILLTIFAVICPIRFVDILLVVGIFRGSGDASFALKAESFSMWVIGVPLAFIGALVLKLNIEQVVMLICCEDVVKFVLCIIHLKRDKWMHSLVSANT